MTGVLLLAGAVVLGLAVRETRYAREAGALAQRLDPRRRARARELRLALPGLVEAVAAALGSGLSIQLALVEIAPTLPPALARPTEHAAASLALGARLDDALRSYERVVPAEDLAPFAIVLGAFARSGGRIGRSLLSENG